MSIIEGLKRDIENPSGTSSPEKDFKKNPADFLENDQGRDLFAEYAEKSSDPTQVELMAKWNANDRSLDLKRFSELTTEFGGKLEKARELAQRMSPDFIQQIAGQSPEFGKFVKTFGAAKMSDLWKQKLPELMVRDAARFAKIETALKSYEKTRDKADEKITKQAEKLGISPEQYASILKISDRGQRRQQMLEVVRERYGGFKRALGYTSGITGVGSEWSAREIANNGRADVEKAIAEMNRSLKELCGPLVDLMSDPASDMHFAYTSVLFRDQATSQRERDVSFSEAQSLFPSIGDFEQSVLAQWNTHKTSVEPGADARAFKKNHFKSVLAGIESSMGTKTESAIMRARKIALAKHLDANVTLV